jgi:hypothetical protein
VGGLSLSTPDSLSVMDATAQAMSLIRFCPHHQEGKGKNRTQKNGHVSERTGLAPQSRTGQNALGAALEGKYDHEPGLDSRTIADGSP